MGSRIILYAAMALLMSVAIIELSFISYMVAWLHGAASGTFSFNFDGSTYDIKGEPKNFIVDQGHTSNGAAGTAFVLVGTGGFITLWLNSGPNPKKISKLLYQSWLVVNVLSLLLVLTALIYTFVVTNNHNGQHIDARYAAQLDGRSKYDRDSWTPQNWFPALLKLDLADPDERSDIQHHVRIIRGWQYNLIPFFIIHLAETAIALWDAKQHQPTKFSPVQQKSDV
ncbi:hypothetical protein B0T10DRAFT_182262 [Thelonectria olida]|uniref:Uncharacterized protein n=1 Tax=Thelonectria olida TaxID=1576542 RepID=A0A9P8WF17_9HYPO|nr:hypothetical protein B0T10DRAFT_182262 [Thelonectria olida]